MANYFNPGSAPVSVSLRHGKVLFLPPKGKGWVDPEDEGSSALSAALRKQQVKIVPGGPPAVPAETPSSG